MAEREWVVLAELRYVFTEAEMFPDGAPDDPARAQRSVERWVVDASANEMGDPEHVDWTVFPRARRDDG